MSATSWLRVQQAVLLFLLLILPLLPLHYPGQHFVCMPNYIAHLIEVC